MDVHPPRARSQPQPRLVPTSSTIVWSFLDLLVTPVGVTVALLMTTALSGGPGWVGVRHAVVALACVGAPFFALLHWSRLRRAALARASREARERARRPGTRRAALGVRRQGRLQRVEVVMVATTAAIFAVNGAVIAVRSGSPPEVVTAAVIVMSLIVSSGSSWHQIVGQGAAGWGAGVCLATFVTMW